MYFTERTIRNKETTISQMRKFRPFHPFSHVKVKSSRFAAPLQGKGGPSWRLAGCLLSSTGWLCSFTRERNEQSVCRTLERKRGQVDSLVVPCVQASAGLCLTAGKWIVIRARGV